jgi:hypothetical protein
VAFMSAKSYSNITDTQFIDNDCPVSPEYVDDSRNRPGGFVSISSCGEALIECEDVHVALQNVQFSRPHSCGSQCPPDVELAVRSMHADYSTWQCSAICGTAFLFELSLVRLFDRVKLSSSLSCCLLSCISGFGAGQEETSNW